MNYLILKIGPTLLKLIFGLLLSIILNLRVMGLLLAFFIGEVITGLVGLKELLKVGGFQKPQFKTLKKILDFSFPIYLAGFSLILFNYSLPFLTSLLWGVDELTLYAAAFTVANLVGALNANLRMTSIVINSVIASTAYPDILPSPETSQLTTALSLRAIMHL